MAESKSLNRSKVDRMIKPELVDLDSGQMKGKLVGKMSPKQS